MNHRLTLRGIVALTFGLLLSATAQAQAFRTYLSGTGNDSNPCSLVAPCRLLPAALAAVAKGGEIWMLDSANYNTGPVNVNKSVTILAVPGAAASLVAVEGEPEAIYINTPFIDVTLRHLVFAPLVRHVGGGGIRMLAGASLTVDNCLFVNLPFDGIYVSTAATVLVKDSTIRGGGNHGISLENGARATVMRSTISGNGNSGIWVGGTPSGTMTFTTADVADSTISANRLGIQAVSFFASAPVRVSVSRSSVVGSSIAALFASANPGASTTLSATNNSISNNAIGMGSDSAGSRILASGNTVTNNTAGFSLGSSGGLIESPGDNAVRANGTDVSGGALAPVAKM